MKKKSFFYEFAAAVIWSVTSIIRLTVVAFIYLAITLTPRLIVNKWSSTTKKRLLKFLLWLTPQPLGRGNSDSPQADGKSSLTSESKVSDPAATTRKLISDAQVAADRFDNLDHLLKALNNAKNVWFPDRSAADAYIGSVALSAYICIATGAGRGMGMPANPKFTRETYLRVCAEVYDSLDTYFEVEAKERK